jgi:hypothetical protein
VRSILDQRNLFSVLGVACALGVVSAPLAEEVSTTSQVSLEDLKKQLEAQSRQLAVQQRELDDEVRRLESQKRALQETKRQLETIRARLGGGAESGTRTEVAQAETGSPQPVGRAPEPAKESRPPAIAPIFEQPGVLTPRGSFILEPSMQYSYSSNNRVALVGFTIIPAITIGLIDIRSVNRGTFIGALTARYGVTNRFEVEAKVPYVKRSDSTLTRPFGAVSETDSAFDSSGNGIGDVEFAARYQLNEGGGDRPYYIGGLRLKMRNGKDPFDVEIDPNTNLEKSLPTGSGFYSIQPSLTAIFPSDPAVFFGSISYLWNMKRDINKAVGLANVGTVDPGDALGFNFGMGLALNEKASFSLGYDHSIVGKDKFDGSFLATSQTRQLGSLLIGYAYRLNNKTSVNLSLGVGVTSEAPNVQLTLRMPFTF